MTTTRTPAEDLQHDDYVRRLGSIGAILSTAKVDTRKAIAETMRASLQRDLEKNAIPLKVRKPTATTQSTDPVTLQYDLITIAVGDPKKRPRIYGRFEFSPQGAVLETQRINPHSEYTRTAKITIKNSTTKGEEIIEHKGQQTTKPLYESEIITTIKSCYTTMFNIDHIAELTSKFEPVSAPQQISSSAVRPSDNNPTPLEPVSAPQQISSSVVGPSDNNPTPLELDMPVGPTSEQKTPALSNTLPNSPAATPPSAVAISSASPAPAEYEKISPELEEKLSSMRTIIQSATPVGLNMIAEEIGINVSRYYFRIRGAEVHHGNKFATLTKGVDNSVTITDQSGNPYNDGRKYNGSFTLSSQQIVIVETCSTPYGDPKLKLTQTTVTINNSQGLVHVKKVQGEDIASAVSMPLTPADKKQIIDEFFFDRYYKYEITDPELRIKKTAEELKKKYQYYVHRLGLIGKIIKLETDDAKAKGEKLIETLRAKFEKNSNIRQGANRTHVSVLTVDPVHLRYEVETTHHNCHYLVNHRFNLRGGAVLEAYSSQHLKSSPLFTSHNKKVTIDENGNVKDESNENGNNKTLTEEEITNYLQDIYVKCQIDDISEFTGKFDTVSAPQQTSPSSLEKKDDGMALPDSATSDKPPLGELAMIVAAPTPKEEPTPAPLPLPPTSALSSAGVVSPQSSSAKRDSLDTEEKEVAVQVASLDHKPNVEVPNLPKLEQTTNVDYGIAAPTVSKNENHEVASPNHTTPAKPPLEPAMSVTPITEKATLGSTPPQDLQSPLASAPPVGVLPQSDPRRNSVILKTKEIEVAVQVAPLDHKLNTSEVQNFPKPEPTTKVDDSIAASTVVLPLYPAIDIPDHKDAQVPLTFDKKDGEMVPDGNTTIIKLLSEPMMHAQIQASMPELPSAPSAPAPTPISEPMNSEPTEDKQVVSEFARYSLTPQQSADNTSLNNQEEKEGGPYTKYAGVSCLVALDLQVPPKNWWSSLWYTTVHVKDDELGLITHNGKKEFLKPGIYYLPRTTAWHRNVKASDSFIQHGDTTVATVPHGHLDHIVNPDDIENRNDLDRNYYLLTHGRHSSNKNAKISKVVDPYGLEVSLDTNPRVCFARACEGKVVYGELTDGTVSVLSVGLSELDQKADENKQQITFKGRLSTKIQSVTLKDVEIELDDETKATIDVMVSYQIPDDANMVNNDEKNSVQKIVKKFGYDEEKIKAGIEKEFESRDDSTNQVTKEAGLAIQEVKKQYNGMSLPRLLRADKITNADQHQRNHYTAPPDGVRFHSFLVTKVNLAPEAKDRQIKQAVKQIKMHMKAELAELEENKSKYNAIRERVKARILAPTEARIAELRSTMNGPAQNPFTMISDASSNSPDRKKSNEKRQRKLENLNPHTISPKDSPNYFRSVTRGIDSDIYIKYKAIPCLSANELKLQQERDFDRGTWFFTRAYEWISNWMWGKTVEEGEVGLIRVQGKAEFLQPGTYHLPPSVEWIGKRSVSEKIIKHDSITIFNIETPAEQLYVEDNTRPDLEYKLLDVGVHVIDSPTLEHRKLVPCSKAVIVEKTKDELSRTKSPLKYRLMPSGTPSDDQIKSDDICLYFEKDKIYYATKTPSGIVKQQIKKSQFSHFDDLLVLLKKSDPSKEQMNEQIKSELFKILIDRGHVIQETYSTPDLDPKYKVLSVTLEPGEVGIYYDERGEINVLDKPGNHDIKPEWKWYTRFSTEEQRKKIAVQAYTADGVCVTVNTTITYQIPPENVCKVIRAFGINKYKIEIERSFMETVIKDIHSLHYLTGAKIIPREQMSLHETAQGPELSFADFANSINTKTLNTLNHQTATNGIKILSVAIDDKITPVYSEIVDANRERLRKIREREKEIEREVTPKIEDMELAQNLVEIGRLTQSLQESRLPNSISQLPKQGFISNSSSRPMMQPYGQSQSQSQSCTR